MIKAKPQASLWRRLLLQRNLQLMAIPGAIFMLIFSYMPMYGIVIAFKNFKITRSIAESPWVGLKYFQQFLGDMDFVNIMTNTLGMSLLSLCIAFPCAILFAMLLNEIANARFKRLVQTISYLPHFLSWVILGGLLITWMSDSGLINDVLVKIGILRQPVTFLGEPNLFWVISVFSDMWKEIGWSAIIYLAAISGIDQELYEAATVDGAGRLRKAWNITLPSISGTVAIMFILAVSGILNANFDQILVLKNPLNSVRSEVFDTYVFTMGLSKGKFSYATAAGLFKSVISMFLLLIANQVSKKLSGQSLF